ncbi:MAG: hypothetical protein KC978_23570, partial [Candidatus Omnitrophica bacterium]|nr:hypothetical protein [Candidatus Omnitrophota bacterium]
YLNAQLLWNPEADPEAITREFVEAVYEDAAPHVMDYLAALEGTTEDQSIHSEVWDGPDAAYITDEFLASADTIWEKAEGEVAQDPEVLKRVQIARLPVDYAILEHARFDGLETLEPDKGKPWGFRIPEELSDRVDRFFDVAESSELSRIREHGITVEDYKAGWTSFLSAPDQEVRSSVEVSNPTADIRYGFYEGRWTQLPDFEELKPVSEGVTENVSLDVSPVEMSYGLRFEGYFKAPETGLYCFTLISNDGTRLFIDKELLIDHDVRHMAIPMGNLIPLEQGFHPIVVEYFQSAGRKHLEMFVEGPGLERQIAGPQLLWHKD